MIVAADRRQARVIYRYTTAFFERVPLLKGMVERQAGQRHSPRRVALPSVPGVRDVVFVDPCGGSSDSMMLAIAHADGQRAVLDCLVERRPPFSPDAVTSEFAATRKTCGVRRVGPRCRGRPQPTRSLLH